MKVNVNGRGFINGIGLLPVKGIDLDENSIRRLFNFQNARVYLAATGEILTPAYFDRQKAEKQNAVKKTAVAVPKASIPVEPVEAPKFESKPMTQYLVEPETVKEPEPEVTVEPEEIVEVKTEEEIPTFTETVESEPITEPVEEVVETTVEADETPVEEKPHFNKKKKRR